MTFQKVLSKSFKDEEPELKEEQKPKLVRKKKSVNV